MPADCHRTENKPQNEEEMVRETQQKRDSQFSGDCGRLGASARSARYFLKEHLLIRKMHPIYKLALANSWQSAL